MKIPDELDWSPTGQTLGEGGQGVVQIVTRKGDPDNHLYALKSLRNVSSPQAQKRFQQEIKTIKGLNHPSIIKIFDHSNENDGFQFYVMEYFPGARQLNDVISSPLTNQFHGNALLSLNLFEQIILAISECEKVRPPVFHRDINPRNILVLDNEKICLIDFGICQIEDGITITFTDENVGTRNYSAPECSSGNDSTIGVHSDIYSAAKVLWSAINSRQVFDREHYVFQGRSMNKMFPRKPESWHLTRIFEKTIREKPENRLQNTSGVLDLIHEVRHLIQSGYPPLEEVQHRCPSCGCRSIGNFEQGYIVFGNPNPRDVISAICQQCGFGFVRKTTVLQENIKKRLELD